jgi:hypothetical protein
VALCWALWASDHVESSHDDWISPLAYRRLSVALCLAIDSGLRLNPRLVVGTCPGSNDVFVACCGITGECVIQYRSTSQRRKFHALLAQGKLSAKVVQEWDDASAGLKLPEHVERTKSAAAKAYATFAKAPGAPAFAKPLAPPKPAAPAAQVVGGAPAPPPPAPAASLPKLSPPPPLQRPE